MTLNSDACYQALASRDARFDGRFFTAVASTGIYCRPVCPAKTPRRENCTFFVTAAEAEAAGYRPCLRCRPELAPGLTPMEASFRLAGMAAMRIEESGLADASLEHLAKTLGISSRHLRRSFQEAYGVSPVAYLMTHRLLTAKTLLTSTELPITEIAMISGFGSLRRFNGLFKERYGLTPSALRQGSDEKRPKNSPVTLELGYRPPLDWTSLLDFLEPRAIPGVEWVHQGAYHRIACIPKNGTLHTGWIRVTHRPDKSTLRLEAAASLSAVLPQVICAVRYLFDLNCVPDHVDAVLVQASQAFPGAFRPGIRLPGCFDPFEMAVRAILGQQITVKGARTLARRLAEAFGRPVESPWDGLTLAFPTPEAIASLPLPIEDQLGPLGITGARARSIRALAETLRDDPLFLSRHGDPQTVRASLQTLPGIGPWTAEYITMRALSWPDAFPHTDLGIRKALNNRSAEEILKFAEAYHPWRAYLTMLLWRTL